MDILADQQTVATAHPAVTVDPQPGTTPTIQPVPVAWHAKRSALGPILTGFFLLFITLPLAVVFVSQQKSSGDIRSKAALCMKCGAGVCPNGLKYGEDICAAVSSCDQRVAQICGGTSSQAPATPAPPPIANARPATVDNIPVITILTDNATGVGTVFGKICPYGSQYVQGQIVFYNAKDSSIVRTAIATNVNAYTIKAKPGSYTAFFIPTSKQLPIFAYTQYVQCGLDPTTCTDHHLLSMTIINDKQYGQVNTCDPQYDQTGLPAEFTYVNK